MTTDHLSRTTVETRFGELTVVASGRGIRAVLWPDEPPGRVPLDDDPADDPTHPLLRRATAQISEYAAGRRTTFDLPLDPRGTPFQRRVWAALATIPFGTTVTYGRLAATVGAPRATRAVGAAVGRNPLSLLVPCHRVVGSSGQLTGFAGGLAVKRSLLDHEAGRRSR